MMVCRVLKELPRTWDPRNVSLWRKRLFQETLPLLLFTALSFLVCCAAKPATPPALAQDLAGCPGAGAAVEAAR